MNAEQFSGVAAQLREPSGEAANKIAEAMEKSNAFIMARAHELLQVKAGETIIEIGPGSGELSKPLVSALGPKGGYVGLEMSEKMAAAARENLQASSAAAVEIIHGDCQQAELQLGRADGLTAVNLVYFIDDLPGLLAKIHSWLGPDGRLTLGIRSPTVMRAMPFEDHGFVIRPLDEILIDLGRAGFHEIGLKYFDEGRASFGELELAVDSVIIHATKTAG